MLAVMKNILKTLLSLCLATVLLVACGKGYDDKILGSWEMDYWVLYSHDGTFGDTPDGYVFTFNPDGKGVMVSPQSTPDSSRVEYDFTPFTYHVDDEDLHMSLHDFELCHIEKLDDTQLILSQTSTTASGSQMVVFSFTKK